MPLTSGFRPHRLGQHFDDHGSDFKAQDEAEYEALADIFLGGPLTDDMREHVRRRDGAIVRYSLRTQAFGVLGKDGFIQSYYVPDPMIHGKSTNYAYFVAECSK